MTGYERIRAVRALRGLSVVQKAVLFVLVSYADNRTGGAWPSVATLSLEAGCSERAVQYSLAELVKLGHIEAWERPRQTRSPASPKQSTTAERSGTQKRVTPALAITRARGRTRKD